MLLLESRTPNALVLIDAERVRYIPVSVREALLIASDRAGETHLAIGDRPRDWSARWRSATATLRDWNSWFVCLIGPGRYYVSVELVQERGSQHYAGGSTVQEIDLPSGRCVLTDAGFVGTQDRMGPRWAGLQEIPSGRYRLTVCRMPRPPAIVQGEYWSPIRPVLRCFLEPIGAPGTHESSHVVSLEDSGPSAFRRARLKRRWNERYLLEILIAPGIAGDRLVAPIERERAAGEEFVVRVLDSMERGYRSAREITEEEARDLGL